MRIRQLRCLHGLAHDFGEIGELVIVWQQIIDVVFSLGVRLSGLYRSDMSATPVLPRKPVNRGLLIQSMVLEMSTGMLNARRDEFERRPSLAGFGRRSLLW